MADFLMEQEFALEVCHFDSRQIARPSAVVEFMQEIATNHADALGLSHTAMETCNAF